MSQDTPIDDALLGLSELAACDLMLAKRFSRRIEACAEDQAGDEHAMALARSYQRMARSYRQTIVVQARLRRELAAEAKADAVDAAKAQRRRLDDHRSAIIARVSPLIWTEREDEREEELDALLDAFVAEAADRPDFLDHTPAQHAAAIIEALNLDAADKDAELATAPTGEAAPAPLFNGRLAPPMDLPPWAGEDTS